MHTQNVTIRPIRVCLRSRRCLYIVSYFNNQRFLKCTCDLGLPRRAALQWREDEGEILDDDVTEIIPRI
jgi:hypothetical protein